MSANKFIAELERRRLLSDRLMAKLRESLAGYDRPLTAEALANFLVKKKHLTEGQAASVLTGLTQSGVNLTEEDASEAHDQVDGSSIFEPQSSGFRTIKPDAPSPETDDDEDEYGLAPIADDTEAATKENVLEEDDLPILSVVAPLEDSQSRVMPEPEEVTEPEKHDVKRAEVVVQPQAAPAVRRTTSLSRARKKRTKKDDKKKKRAKPSKEKKRWDSPLILVGGGGLTLLLLVGGTLYWLLTQRSGDQVLAQAEAALKAGTYAQAIQQYDDFLKNFPRHSQHSLARVELALVRIRQPTEAGDYPAAIAAAEKELKAVEDEPAFSDAGHGELAALLPQIAQGAATAAEEAKPTSDDANKLVDVAKQAIALCNNASYVPKTLRDEAKLTNVQDTLDRVARRQRTHLALSEGLKSIEQAIAAGKPVAAYSAHRKLLREHPELTDDASLAAAIQKTTAAEKAAIHFVKEDKAALTTERPAPWRAALAVANRRVKPSAPPTGVSGTTCISIDGAVYGLDAASGRLLWRRPVGFGATAPPVLVEHDVIVSDRAHNELQRLDAAMGRLIWRAAVGETFNGVLVDGNRGFVPTKSGRLYVFDLKSGARKGYLQFDQPLPVVPAIDRQGTRIYVPGDEGSLYSISLADMKCIGVNYLGHAPGSIRVPAVAVMDKVAVIENDGVETSRLRLMSLDNKGAISKQVAERRLNGLPVSASVITGRGMIVVTDRGQIEAYEIATGSGAKPLSVVAGRDATDSQPLMRYVAVTGRDIWIADNRLTKYSIVATDNRLPVEEIENNFSGATFDHPLAAFGDLLIHVRRPKDRAGFVVAAIDTNQGHTIWETDLAIPPAGPPVVDNAGKALVIGSAEGYVFRFDEAAIRSRVQDEAVGSELMPADFPSLTAAVDLGQGRAAFCAAGSNRLLLYNRANATGAKWLQLPSPLACPITPLGQGFVAPLKIGQVFYLSSADGARLATPFQPQLDPQVALEYKPAAAVGNDGRQFVVTDGRQKIYLVALVDQPSPRLEQVKQADAGPHPIESPIVVLGNAAVAVAGGTHLIRFQLPSLETIGETDLSTPVEEGPFRAAGGLLVTTADDKLIDLSAEGNVKWQEPIQNGPLAGPPLVLPDSIVLAYRKGVIERRSLADGKIVGTANLQQPVATGPVAFMQHLVLAGPDGTLLVVDMP
ncbi:MAG TPA: PQQ-binding-like beta-propeller repeat protein [Lacipirellulaceae bacterium]|nr:PQQ-binding-like beta-propeller repeat protein [Lacipirellulaceae bacterium]